MARRRGKKIATTAVARKLLARAYHLLTAADAVDRERRSTGRRKPTTSRTTATTNDQAPGTRRERPQTGTVTSPGRARKTG